MDPIQQKQFVINFVLDWAGSSKNAERWYQKEFIPALNMTPMQAVETGNFVSLKVYLEGIKLGGYA